MNIEFLNKIWIWDVNGNKVRIDKGSIGEHLDIDLGEFVLIQGIKYPLSRISSSDYTLN